jgi:hypothetical protein
MGTSSKYSVPLSTLEAVQVPVEQQVVEQDVHVHREYLTPEELDRARLLSTSEAGRLRLR